MKKTHGVSFVQLNNRHDPVHLPRNPHPPSPTHTPHHTSPPTHHIIAERKLTYHRERKTSQQIMETIPNQIIHGHRRYKPAEQKHHRTRKTLEASTTTNHTRLSNSYTREPDVRRPRKDDNTHIFLYRYITDDEPATYILLLSSSECSKKGILSYMRVRVRPFPLNRRLLPRLDNRANRGVGQHKLSRRFPSPRCIRLVFQGSVCMWASNLCS